MDPDKLETELMAAEEPTEVPKPVEPYAIAHDIIADIERRLLEVDEYIEDVENKKRKLDNTMRMEIEIKAEDKASGLSNEKKRQIAYEELADGTPEFRSYISWLKEARREQKKLRIELGNEQRAFQLKVKGVQ